MDQETFEALRGRVERMERRLRQMVGLLILSVVGLAIALVVNLSGHTAFAQSFSRWSKPIYYFKDSATNSTCYSTGSDISCVKD